MPKIKLGIIGLSEGNGHPYSFSAIINGYDPVAMKASGWTGIFEYLEAKDTSDFLLNMAEVTHVWTQCEEESLKISKACKIPNICNKIEDMLGKVDAVIIARDDYEKHFAMAKPFLESGMKVFVDKPLSLNKEELQFFKPYLESGSLMSCSGLRYARELDNVRIWLKTEENLKLVRASVVLSWEKYGIHMLDALFGMIDFNVKSVIGTKSKHTSVLLKMTSGTIVHIDALGSTVKTFEMSFWSDTQRESIEISDNFTAFKRAMYHFIKMIETGKPQIEPLLTISIMKVLIAANLSIEKNREVFLDEITM
jgi:predicted dehydrogenase